MKRPLSHAALVLLLAVPLLSCVKSPSSPGAPADDSEQAPSSAVPLDPAARESDPASPDGKGVAAYTEKPELADYVRTVGKKIAARSDRTKAGYRFDIVDSGDVNAGSRPGGTVYVTRGLLARMSSEDELAAALGREVATLAGDAGSLDASESARRGARLAKDAGYKTRGSVDLLRTLAAVRSAEPARLEAWLAAHRGDSARIANLDAEIQKLVGTDPDALGARGLKRDPYLRKIDGLPVGWVGPAGYLKGARYMDIRQDFSIQVPEGWTIAPADDVLVLLHPAGGSRAEVAALPNLRPGVSGDAALDYARRAPQEGYEVTKPVGHATLPIGESANVTMHAKGEAGSPTSVRKMFMTRFDKLYVLTFIVPVEREDETMSQFMSMTGSMKWLTPEETTPPPTPRIALDTVKEGETWKSIAAERLGGDWRAAALAAWNGRDAAEAPSAGMLIKVPPRAAFE